MQDGLPLGRVWAKEAREVLIKKGLVHKSHRENQRRQLKSLSVYLSLSIIITSAVFVT